MAWLSLSVEPVTVATELNELSMAPPAPNPAGTARVPGPP
jgi:hypothetical protein